MRSRKHKKMTTLFGLSVPFQNHKHYPRVGPRNKDSGHLKIEFMYPNWLESKSLQNGMMCHLQDTQAFIRLMNWLHVIITGPKWDSIYPHMSKDVICATGLKYSLVNWLGNYFHIRFQKSL